VRERVWERVPEWLGVDDLEAVRGLGLRPRRRQGRRLRSRGALRGRAGARLGEGETLGDRVAVAEGVEEGSQSQRRWGMQSPAASTCAEGLRRGRRARRVREGVSEREAVCSCEALWLGLPDALDVELREPVVGRCTAAAWRASRAGAQRARPRARARPAQGRGARARTALGPRARSRPASRGGA